MNNMKKLNIEDLFVIVALITPGFADINGLLPLNLSQIMVIGLFFIIMIRNFRTGYFIVPKFLICLIFYIIINTFIINVNGVESVKTMIMLIIYIYTFYNYIINQKSFDKIINLLFNISFFISFIAIIQEIAYFLNIEWLYNFSIISINNSITTSGEFLRVTSILSEPAHLAIFLVPGISIILIDLLKIYRIEFRSKFKYIIILICSFLTFSMIIYLTILILIGYFMIFFKGEFNKKIIFILVVLVVISVILFRYKDSLLIIKYKFESLFTLESLDTNNLSSFAIISNFKIALYKLKEGYILGTGLDSHVHTYFNYIDTIYAGKNVVMYLNYEDAASIYIRIFSEFGIIGLFLYVIFIIKKGIYKLKNINSISYNYLINKISFIGVITYGIRMGTYINAYFILLCVLLIISSRRLRKGIEYNE